MNYLLDDLNKLGELYSRDELWNVIDTKYRNVSNKLKSELKKYPNSCFMKMYI